MNIHKNARLLPFQRQAIWDAYTKDKRTVVSLAEEYKVSRPVIYKVLKLISCSSAKTTIEHQ